MPIRHLLLAGAAALLGLGAAAAAPLGAAGGAPAPALTTASGTPPSGLPQPAAAQAAAVWLASKFAPGGFVPTTTPGSSTPNLSSTAQSVLALAAADTDLATARAGMAYLSSAVTTYVTEDGSDGPGKLALLMLDAEALGENPAAVGGSDLATLLLATQQTIGTQVGMFGTTAQLSTYVAGEYQQGLALAALAGAGVRGTAATTAGVAWLKSQQCPDGGWTTTDDAATPCSAPPATFMGPNTNATALAVEGLAAQGALTAAVLGQARRFLAATENADGGWAYYPQTGPGAQSSDPDSTALVIQALLAAGVSPDGASFSKDGVAPAQRLLSFQLSTGPDAGALYFATPTTPGLLATYEAVPAMAGLAIPFGTGGQSYWLATAEGSVTPYGGATTAGSLSALGVTSDDVVAMAATPDGRGYWLAGADGGIFAFGDAPYDGSLPALGVATSDVVAMAATADGGGYWLFGRDGGVFAFGDAAYHGSLPALGVGVDDVVGAAVTPDGGGYWLVGSDGGIFAFGDAAYQGSLPAKGVTTDDITGLATTADGHGYWVVGSDGGVFAFADAPYEGSLPALGVKVDDVVGVLAGPGGAGYDLLGSDGGVFAFGDAVFAGAAGTGSGTVVGGALDPARPA